MEPCSLAHILSAEKEQSILCVQHQHWVAESNLLNLTNVQTILSLGAVEI